MGRGAVPNPRGERRYPELGTKGESGPFLNQSLTLKHSRFICLWKFHAGAWGSEGSVLFKPWGAQNTQALLRTC